MLGDESMAGLAVEERLATTVRSKRVACTPPCSCTTARPATCGTVPCSDAPCCGRRQVALLVAGVQLALSALWSWLPCSYWQPRRRCCSWKLPLRRGPMWSWPSAGRSRRWAMAWCTAGEVHSMHSRAALLPLHPFIIARHPGPKHAVLATLLST